MTQENIEKYADFYKMTEDEHIKLGAHVYPIKHFLEYCANPKLSIPNSSLSDIEMSSYRQHFIQAGVNALDVIAESDEWVQINVMASQGGIPNTALYESVGLLFQQTIENKEASNVFFMHKSPGLRLRIQATDHALTPCIKERLINAAHEWQQKDLISDYYISKYEPESTLFGGKISMKYMHQLFTLDSFFWLKYLADKNGQHTIRRLQFSVIILRYFLTALEIVDWEDLDVWEKVSSRTGRSIPDPSALKNDLLTEVNQQIVELWNNPNDFISELSSNERNAVQDLAEQYTNICKDWLKQYFKTEYATVGPRAAAAAYIIFFWNRANINFEQQIIATHALCRRKILE